MILISVVYNGERHRTSGWCEGLNQVRIPQDSVRGIFAVSVVPVVASIDDIHGGGSPFFRNFGSLCHQAAQALRGRKGAFVGICDILDDRGHIELAVAKPYAVAPVADVEPN